MSPITIIAKTHCDKTYEFAVKRHDGDTTPGATLISVGVKRITHIHDKPSKTEHFISRIGIASNSTVGVTYDSLISKLNELNVGMDETHIPGTGTNNKHWVFRWRDNHYNFPLLDITSECSAAEYANLCIDMPDVREQNRVILEKLDTIIRMLNGMSREVIETTAN